MNLHYYHNALTTQKNVAVFFNDVKTDKTSSSQDQKLVETTNLFRQFFRTKNHHSANSLLQRALTQ